MLLSASLDALTPRSHVATCRVGAAPGLLVPDGAASRAGAAASVSLRRVPGALQCAQQPHSGGGFLRRAAGGDAASARRRRRSLARGAGVLSVASAAVEETGGAAAAVTESPFSGAHAKELRVAVDAVRIACTMCQKIQAGIMVQEEEGLDTKKDRSLVTTADYATQALISWMLAEAFGATVSLVAEEDSASLRDGAPGAAMLDRVTAAVNEALAGAGKPPLTPEQVLAAIDRGGSAGGREGRHWVLDPVDGTLGFVRGDQYAVALALLEEGRVVAGVLGCPNMPTRPDVMESADALSYGFSPRLVSKMLAGARGAGAWYKGVLFCAARGTGTWMSPSEPDVPVAPRRVQVSTQTDTAQVRMCEPVLKANSSQGFTAAVASALGMASKPLRLYSMVKYGAVARGDADVFMKFPKAGYKEKIWDHAAGVVVVEEAGGVVTDAGGEPLDFGAGRFLEHLDRGIVASSSVLHPRLLNAVASSWASSML